MTTDLHTSMREWSLIDEGGKYGTCMAASAASALAQAVDDVDRDALAGDSTVWWDVRVDCDLTGESECVTVEIDPPPPPCVGNHEHAWVSPHAAVGGLRENPGVWGHGGGTITRRICAHCGRTRITDTWAQRPDTGEQGLTSVSYEPATPDARAWIAARAQAHEGPLVESGLDDACDALDGEWSHDDRDHAAYIVSIPSDRIPGACEMIGRAIPDGWTVAYTSSDPDDGTLRVYRD